LMAGEPQAARALQAGDVLRLAQHQCTVTSPDASAPPPGHDTRSRTSSLAGGRLSRRAVLTLHDARYLAVDLVDRRLRARDEALALLPDLLVRVALAGIELAKVRHETLGGLDLVREVARREILVQCRHLARPRLQGQPLAVQRDQAPAENT